jgi:hypothetical protein
VKALSGTAPPFTVEATGGVADPVDVVPESAVDDVAVAVIKLLEDVLDVEPEALPDVLELPELDDVPDELGADDNETELDALEEVVLGEALVRT